MKKLHWRIARLPRRALIDLLDEAAGVGCVDERTTDDLRGEVGALFDAGTISLEEIREYA